MPAKYTVQLSPEQLKAIMEDPERIGVDVPTVVGTDTEGNQLPSIGIHILGPISDMVEVPVEDTEEVIVEPSEEEEEIGNVAPEEEAAIAAMGFDPMTESKISSFSTFLKRK